MTPTVVPSSRLSIRYTVTNNTASAQPILATMTAYDARGRVLATAFSKEPATIPASRRLRETFRARLPNMVNPRLMGIPIYLVTTLRRSSDGAFIDDDYSVVYVLPG